MKVLDGCWLNQKYWVFIAATTNVAYGVQVGDTTISSANNYLNPLNHAAYPVQDTSAFDCTPQ